MAGQWDRRAWAVITHPAWRNAELAGVVRFIPERGAVQETPIRLARGEPRRSVEVLVRGPFLTEVTCDGSCDVVLVQWRVKGTMFDAAEYPPGNCRAQE